MKKAIIAILVLIVIITGFFVIKNNSNSKYDYEISKITEYNYFVSCDTNGFGVIDKNGEEIINATYTNVIIPNPQEDIFICYDEENTKVLNSKQEEIFTKYEKVEPIKLKNVASSLIYEKSILMYEKDGKYGIIDFKGNEITKNIYDSIENLQPTEGKFLVKQNDKYGVIDLKGNELINTEYDQIVSDGYYTENEGYKKSGFIVSNKNEDGFKYGYINYKGNKILDLKYNEISRVSKEDEDNIYLIVSENGQYGFYNKSKQLIENEYQSIVFDENTDLLIIQKNKNYGVANLTGKIIIDIKNYQVASKGIYIYTEDTVYDKEGNKVDINYNKSIYETENEDYKISTTFKDDITYYGIMDKNGNQLVEEEYRYIEYLFSNYFIATDDNGALGIINSNGKVILDMKYDSLQKIKGTHIIQAIPSGKGTSEFYSENIKEIDSVQSANIQIHDEYVVINGNDKTLYLDYNGNQIKDTTNLKNTNFPDKIGDYVKEQNIMGEIYYVKD